jgi:hypothetical protein
MKLPLCRGARPCAPTVNWLKTGNLLSGNHLTGTPDPINGGLFGDPYQASAELEYAKSFGKDDKNNVAVRLQYTRASTFNLH